MARVKVWYDEEGDFLEVRFADRPGHFEEVEPDVFERVDAEGRVLGFAIFGFAARARQPVEVPLALERVAEG